MEVIRGCSTVNRGLVKVYKYKDYLYSCEILAPSISGHSDNIVNTYDIVEGVKTCIGYSLDSNNQPIIQIYKFRQPFESQHYWSRVYKLNTVPEKYHKYINELAFAYRLEFLSH